MNVCNDETSMIELTQEELDAVFGTGGDGYYGACGGCGYGYGACGGCGYGAYGNGPFVSAFTTSNVNKFSESASLATSCATTNSFFTYYGN